MSLEEIRMIGDYLIEIAIFIVVFWSKTRTGKGIKNIKIVLDEHTATDRIKASLHQRLEVVTLESLKYSRLDRFYLDMLGSWSEKFEDFAINSFFSKYRKTNDVENYLKNKAGSLLTDIDFMLLQRIPVKKEEMSIVDFAKKKTGLYKEVDLLVRSLVKNGLTDEKYVSLFADSVNRILNEGINLFQDWNELNSK